MLHDGIYLISLAISLALTAYGIKLLGPFYRRLQQRREQKRPWRLFPLKAIFNSFEGGGYFRWLTEFLIVLIFLPAILCYAVASPVLWGIHRMIFGLTPKHIAIPNYAPSILGLGVAVYEIYLFIELLFR